MLYGSNPYASVELGGIIPSQTFFVVAKRIIVLTMKIIKTQLTNKSNRTILTNKNKRTIV